MKFFSNSVSLLNFLFFSYIIMDSNLLNTFFVGIYLVECVCNVFFLDIFFFKSKYIFVIILIKIFYTAMHIFLKFFFLTLWNNGFSVNFFHRARFECFNCCLLKYGKNNRHAFLLYTMIHQGRALLNDGGIFFINLW